MEDHALIPWCRVGEIELLGRRRAIDTNVGVVDGSASRSELEPPHVSRAGERHGDDEVSEYVCSSRGHHVFRKRDGKVRHPPGPTVCCLEG